MAESFAMKKTFVLIPKQVNNPFFDVVRNGCFDESVRLGNVECRYLGPEEANGWDQYNIVQSLVQDHRAGVEVIHGIALSVVDEFVANQAVALAVEAGIPVVTFDSDAPNSQRLSYIGTNNYALGRSLGKILLQLRPEGGSYGVISAAAPNVMTRVEGLRSYLGETAWTELGSPKDSKDSIDVSLDLMWEFPQQYPQIDAIVPVGGWPMFDSNTTRYRHFVDAHRHLTLVVADTLPVQVELLTNGYVDGLVGQVPYQMGVECVKVLNDYTNANDSVVPNEILGTSVMEFVRVPLLLPEPNLDQNLLDELVVVGYTLFGIIAGLSVLSAAWTLWKRRVRVVRASQPIFLVMIATGTLLLGFSVVPLSLDDSREGFTKRQGQIMCMSVPWLASLGFTITFSALFSKTWRINRIFHGRDRFSRVRVTERDVMVPLVVLLSFNLVVLTCWTIISPLEYRRESHEGTDGWNRVISTYGSCRAPVNSVSWSYMVLLGVINLGVLVIANWQAYEARSIQSEFSESRYIAVVMASMLQACFSGLPILFLVRELPQAYYLILTFMVFIICLAILLLIFVPKIVYERSLRKEDSAVMARQIRLAIRSSMAPGSKPGYSSSHTASVVDKGNRFSSHIDNDDDGMECIIDNDSSQSRGSRRRQASPATSAFESRNEDVDVDMPAIDEELAGSQSKGGFTDDEESAEILAESLAVLNSPPVYTIQEWKNSMVENSGVGDNNDNDTGE